MQIIKHKIIQKFGYLSKDSKRINDVGKLLSALDEKVELNKKMNKNLEEIAKTLFKSWFIDFDQ